MANTARMADTYVNPVAAQRSRARWKRLSIGGRSVILAALILLAVLFSLPFVWLVLTSLKEPASVFAPGWIPDRITLENYEDVFKLTPVDRWLRNSFLVAILGAASVVFSSSLVAFGFSRLRFRGRNALFVLVMATYMVPAAITMVPTFLIWNELGLVGTYYPLWAGNLFGFSFYIFMLRQFFLTIPQDLVDAARIDGAGYFRIFWSILLPLVKPALAAVAVLEFQAKWNDFITPLIYLNKPSMYTMSLGLGLFRSEYETQWSLLMAASVVFTVPMVVLFFIAQRYFIEGISTTGLKS